MKTTSLWTEKEFCHKHGVYSIRNKITGDRYIGSSAGRGFGNRRGTHWQSLKDHQHHSTYLQNSWNKYGEDNFAFEVILYCDAKHAINYEQKYIDYYKPKYNMSLTAGSCYGMKRSQITKDKIGNIHRGKIVSLSVREQMSQTHTILKSVSRMQTLKARQKATQSRLISMLCRGTSKYNSKTNEREVIVIRALYTSGMNFNQISHQYNHLNRRTIRDICLKKSWKHV